MESRTLLIVSGGIEAADAAKRAKELGLHVVVSDMNPNAPGFEFADDRLIARPTSRRHRRSGRALSPRRVRPIDGVITIGCRRAADRRAPSPIA